MGKTKLQVLGIEVPLGFCDVFHDDGFVSSIRDHTVKLAKKYGVNSIENRCGLITDINAIRERPARYVCFNGIFRDHHHIFYRDVGFVENLISRGHEESEFLEEIDRLDLLSSALLPYTNRRIDFNGIRDGEVKNHFGSVYALIRHDIPFEKIFEVTKPHPQLESLRLLIDHYWN